MHTHPFQKNIRDQRGIAIYVAVVITSALVLVSFSVIALAIKEVGNSAASRDSQAAFYAADSGVECALYWDLKQASFATNTPATVVSCNNVATTPTRVVDPSGTGTSTFSFSFLPADQYCTIVDVVKSYDAGGVPKTKIESRGYNSCSMSNTRRVERAVLVGY